MPQIIKCSFCVIVITACNEFALALCHGRMQVNQHTINISLHFSSIPDKVREAKQTAPLDF